MRINMKVTEILEIANKPMAPDQVPLIASLMAIRLREIYELMPEIKIAIQDVYSYRANAVSKKGKKWATEYDALLKQIEGWENE